MQEIGVELAPIDTPYPVYIFEYVSAGGNSSEKTTVTLNSPTIDEPISTLSDKIRRRKSAAGQRALMTARLRSAIKTRDNHTCQNCQVSVRAEPHLLLEVDHILPISRGGLSAEENLQPRQDESGRVLSGTQSQVGAQRGMFVIAVEQVSD